MYTFTLSKTQITLNAIKNNCEKAVHAHIKQVFLPEIVKQVEVAVDKVVADYLAQVSITLQEDPTFRESKIQFCFPEIDKGIKND